MLLHMYALQKERVGDRRRAWGGWGWGCVGIVVDRAGLRGPGDGSGLAVRLLSALSANLGELVILTLILDY